MKREFLKAMGLTDEQIDKIMDEHGKTTNSLKTENETYKTELNSTKEQLSEANKAIDSYKGMNIEDIKKSAEDYKTKYEESEKINKEAIEKLKLDHAIENRLIKEGAKNTKAVKAILDLSNIKLENDNLVGFDDLIKASKENDPYLYNIEDSSNDKFKFVFGGKSSEETPKEGSYGAELAKSVHSEVKDIPYFK